MRTRYFPISNDYSGLSESLIPSNGQHSKPVSVKSVLAFTLTSLLSLSASVVSANAAELLVSTSTAKAPSKVSEKSSKFFARAVQYYQVQDFKSAELIFRQAIAEGPGDPNSHYYLANTLVHLSRHDEAIEEFKRSYNLDPFGPTSGYCRKALKAYAESQTAQKASQKEHGDESAEALDATSSIAKYAQKDTGKSNPQEKLVALRSQAEREKVRHQRDADSYGRAMNSTGEGEAQTIRANAREEIDQILHGTRNNMPWVQQAAQQRAAEVQHNADELEKIAHERASERAAEYKSVSKAKSRALDETVSNLERQLVTKTLPGTPSLRHDGTDLFVRSYSPAASKSPYPDAHPAVARVNPTHVLPAEDDDAGSAKTRATTIPKHDVKGKVLD